jgi:ElaB/YqjD/DUF883 family membrane-anchored ribosome-binding protein
MTLESETTGSAQATLEATRQKVEDRLGALRQAINDSTGGRLGRSAWTMPLIAAAVGFSIALLMRRRRARGNEFADDDADYF